MSRVHWKRSRKSLLSSIIPKWKFAFCSEAVGGISLADVTLATASDAVIVGFNVIPDEKARSLADERNVEIRRYDVIYKLTDDIKAMIEGRLET